MKPKGSPKHQRRSTRFSDDGRSVFVQLHVDRRAYEFAKGWAEIHGPADPAGTAEEQLEGYLGSALWEHMAALEWKASPEIEALFATPEGAGNQQNPLDDGIPF